MRFRSCYARLVVSYSNSSISYAVFFSRRVLFFDSGACREAMRIANFCLLVIAVACKQVFAEELCDDNGAPTFREKLSVAHESERVIVEHKRLLFYDRLTKLRDGANFHALGAPGFMELRDNAPIQPQINSSKWKVDGLLEEEYNSNVFGWQAENSYVSLESWRDRLFRTMPPLAPDDPERKNIPIALGEVPALKKCDKAAAEFNDMKQPRTVDTMAVKAACKILQFDKYCLTNKNYPAFVNKVEEVEAVFSVLTVILSANGTPYCMGILTKKDEQFYLVTSRHCFIDRVTGRALKDIAREARTVNGNKVAHISEAAVATIEIPCFKECQLPIGAYGPEQDAVAIKVSITVLGKNEPYTKVYLMDPVGCNLNNGLKASNCTKVWVVGTFPSVTLARLLEKNKTGKAIDKTLKGQLRWTMPYGDYARMNYVEDNCSYYSAQTAPGFSGSPLVAGVERNGQGWIVKIAGVHIGASGSVKEGWPACKTDQFSPDRARLFLNMADLKVDFP